MLRSKREWGLLSKRDWGLLTSVICVEDYGFIFLAGIILCMWPANQRWRYNVTSPLIGWADIQYGPCLCITVQSHYYSISLYTAKLVTNENQESLFNTLRPRQHDRHFTDDFFKRIFLNENLIVSIKISLKFVPKGPINNIPALVQIMAWRWPGDKPLSEAMMVSLLTHICVTRPQWVNILACTR